jgi:hypothetical protein
MDTLYAISPIPELEILSCSNDRQFAPHLHEGYVLWLNSAAGEHFQVKGASDILQPGSISIIEPGVVHANRPCSPERRHLRSFYFSEQFLVNMSWNSGDMIHNYNNKILRTSRRCSCYDDQSCAPSLGARLSRLSFLIQF